MWSPSLQAVAAGGIGVLAFLVARTTGTPLDERERVGVVVAISGLALLGISLAGGSEQGGRVTGPRSRGGSAPRPEQLCSL